MHLIFAFFKINAFLLFVMQKNRNNIIEYNNIIPFLNKKRDRK